MSNMYNLQFHKIEFCFNLTMVSVWTQNGPASKTGLVTVSTGYKRQPKSGESARPRRTFNVKKKGEKREQWGK